MVIGVDDIYACLGNMSKIRKDAICYCLFSDISIEQAIYLKWGDTCNSLSENAATVLNEIQVSDKTDYVFWENDLGNHVPLITLRASFEVNTMGIGWDKFSKIYKHAVSINFEHDYKKIIGLLTK